jgi:sulfate permease, SulP family
VQVGVLLAVFLFLKRMTETASIQPVLDLIDADTSRAAGETTLARPKGVEVYEINGPFFFGTADFLQDVLDQIERAPVVFILRMRRVPAVDASGMNALESFRRHCVKHGTVLILSGVGEQPRKALDAMGLTSRIGDENVVPDINAAIARAATLVESRHTARSHHA